MFWATTTFKVSGWSGELDDALRGWKAHIDEAHPLIREVRCYRADGGTTVRWQEGFADFRDYQTLMEQEDEVCESVMAAVFRHMGPGTREGRIWSDIGWDS